MARRLFFVEQVHSGQAIIEGDDAAHLTRVLRVESGQRYEISDNHQLYLAEVLSARKSEVRFSILEKLPLRPPPVRLHLFAALIKFDHLEWTLEKATELGVEQITPIVSERVEHGLDRAAVKRSERWRKIVKESSQQCRRWRMPELHDVASLRQIATQTGFRFLLDEAGGQPILAALPTTRSADDEVNLIIGPEGGWADKERTLLLDSGWTPVSLGPSILRAETAATAALAILSAAWQLPQK